MPENDFLSQSSEDFLQYNPEDFLDGENQVIYETTKENSHLKTEIAIAVGIGVSVLVWLAISRRKLREQKPQSTDEAYAALKMVWGKTAPVWLQIATPAVASAYQVASKQVQMSDRQLADIAREYSQTLGNYINATSDNAIVEGFAAQLNKNVNPSIAWERAVEGYGLDRQQMRSYITKTGANAAEYQTEAVPSGLKKVVSKMLHGRADRIARHEAWASMTMGKNVVWLYQQEMGILPKDAMKMWITAEDERVCPICAPMDKKTVPINEKFETTAGQFWTPGVHVNCRCDIRIILPDDRESLRKDWDENKYLRGQPGNRGQFRSKPKPQTSTKEQAADYSRLSDWIDVSLDEVPKKSLFSEPEKKVNAFGIKQSAFTGEKKSAFTSPKTSAFTETAKAPANTFTEQEKKPPVRRRKVVTWVYINGKHERREFEPPDVPEEQQYIKQDGKVAFVPYFGFKSRFQGREHKIVNPWNRESSEQIANIDTTDLEMGSIPVISNAYVENEPIEITGDNLSVIDIPESLRLAIKDSLAQANLWLSEEQKAYERDVVVNEDFDDEEEGSTLGATDNTYNFTPAVVGFSDFYSVNTELDNINSNGSDNVAGTYKIRMAEPSGQEGEIVNHLLTPTDDRKLTFRLSVKDFQSIYNDLSDSKIIWESNSSTSPVYNPDIAKSFPELFFSNPWSDDRWVTVVYAQPTAPPEV